jgi:hypothetical protein
MRRHWMGKRFLLAVLCAAAFTGLSAGSALAGEITGNGKPTAAPAHANSECSFSGRDDPDADDFVHTQSWGQIPQEERAFLASIGVAPWTLCNGHLSPRK